MTIRPLTRDEVRGLDARAAEELGLPTLILMENAGRGAADWLHDRAGLEPGRVAIVCGPGNNGGDGGVVARHLDAHGWDVRVAWFAEPSSLRGDAATQHAILEKSGIDQADWGQGQLDEARLASSLAGADWIVDGLLGTGLTRPVEGTLRSLIEALNRSTTPILALDLPSGLDAETGRPQGVAIRASATATFVAPKVGFSQPGAPEFTGEVVVVPIGLPRRLLRAFEESAR